MITYAKINGGDIQRLVDKIEDTVEGEHRLHVSLACLIVAIMAQKPDIDSEELQETVKVASEYLAASLFADTNGSVN